MAYRKPAVTVIQEFLGLVPALAPFSLPSVAVGATYQLVDNDLLGTYVGNLQAYPYASKMAGAAVDLEEEDPEELYPATKKPIEVTLKNAVVEVLTSQTTGRGVGTSFSDVSVGQFADVLAGDLVVIIPSLGVEIIAPQTDGVSAAATPTVLTAGTPGQFADVLAGDIVTVTAGTNAVPGVFTVLVNTAGNSLKLDSSVNTGGGASTDTAYSIAGDRGVVTEGSYRVRSKTDPNTLVLEGALAQAEYPLTYSVNREVALIVVDRDPLTGFTPIAASISLPAALSVAAGPILSADVYANYRALRNDKAATVLEYAKLADLQADFGVTQITPQNPLAYALSLMLQNTVTPVNGLGLDGLAVTDESLSFLNAADVLGMTEMYAIVLLTQNPAIHQIYKTHVEGQSALQKERVVIVNRTIKLEETLVPTSTTSVATSGARIIVNTQLDGDALVAFPTILNDATPDAFLNVQPGDSVVIVGGTNSVPGTYTVVSKQSSNQITLSGNVVVGGNSTDLQYYIVRRDGLSFNGTTFYDREATFISSGVSAGMIVRIASGTFAGDQTIASVTSETELEVAQVPGVVTLETAVEYSVVRNLSKTEQAAFISGYSAALASRRVVNVWPDTLSAPVGQTLEDVPGFYGGCAIGAITTGLPTQQGFTNLSISGFLGLQHSTKYFTDAQLDTIADGGTMILAQEGDQSPLFIRHQLTTDRSAIKFQEYSVTKNVDFISKFLRRTYAPFIGVYNITDAAKDELRGTAKAALSFLKDSTRLPKIGGVIRGGQLASLIEDPANIDTILMTFRLDIPIPLNNLIITVQV
jgi:hypothetical protein